MERKRLEEKPKSKRGGARPGAGRKGGRPQLGTRDERIAFGKMCRALTDYCLSGVKKLLEDEECPHTVRLSGYFGLLDRGYGKPAQAMEVYGLGQAPALAIALTQEVLDGSTDEELEVLAKVAERAARSAGGDQGEADSSKANEKEFAATVGYTGSA